MDALALACLRTCTFATLGPLAPAHLPSAGSGDVLARLVSDVTTLEQFYVRALAPPMVAVFILCTASTFMALFHWQLAAATDHISAGRFDGLYLGSLVLVTFASFEATLPLSQATQHIQSSLQSARRLLALERVQPAVAEPTVSPDTTRGPTEKERSLRSYVAASRGAYTGCRRASRGP